MVALLVSGLALVVVLSPTLQGHITEFAKFLFSKKFLEEARATWTQRFP